MRKYGLFLFLDVRTACKCGFFLFRDIQDLLNRRGQNALSVRVEGADALEDDFFTGVSQDQPEGIANGRAVCDDFRLIEDKAALCLPSSYSIPEARPLPRAAGCEPHIVWPLPFWKIRSR